jgi:hypothetical protein
MKPHEERVLEEKRELDVKIDMLTNFFQTAVYTKLGSEERYRLDHQISYMRNYSMILGQRIQAFT